MIKETVYGGKIDSECDQKILDSFVDKVFVEESYDEGFSLVGSSAGEKLVIPDGTKLTQFLDWTRNLPDQQPPHWLGLSSNAENVLVASKSIFILN